MLYFLADVFKDQSRLRWVEVCNAAIIAQIIHGKILVIVYC